MKPFDLDAALAGKPVVTRDGSKVDQIILFPERVIYPVVVHIEGYDSIYQLSKNGIVDPFQKFPYGAKRSQFDLFMAPTTVTKWVNLYPSDTSDKRHFSIWNTKEEAEAVAAVNRIGDTAFQITYEE